MTLVKIPVASHAKRNGAAQTIKQPSGQSAEPLRPSGPVAPLVPPPSTPTAPWWLRLLFLEAWLLRAPFWLVWNHDLAVRWFWSHQYLAWSFLRTVRGGRVPQAEAIRRTTICRDDCQRYRVYSERAYCMQCG